MSVPKAVKRGKTWRVQVQHNGQRLSFTGKTEAEAVRLAMEFKSGIKKADRAKEAATVGDLMTRYIELKRGSFSPSTIYGYEKIKKNYFADIQRRSVNRITDELVQAEVDALARRLSPKTVSNAYGFLRKVITHYRPGYIPSVTLPQREKTELYIPSDADVAAVIAVVSGTDMELPIALAAHMGLRLSEVCALDYADVRGGKAHIRRAIVYSGKGYSEKSPKSYSGDRYIDIPSSVARLMDAGAKRGRVVALTPAAVQKRFWNALDAADVEHFRFHDLRHYYVSTLLLLGLPMNYIIERTGHSTRDMVERVYGHVFTAEQEKFSRLIDERFSRNAPNSAPTIS